MNQREKEEYLREYSILKSQGKPFFPYAVAKDSLMGVLVVAVIIAMALLFGSQMGPKADGATTTYVPRPDWYFFFLFELLRVIHPPGFVGLATLGIPTLGMILLFLLPFYDRSPVRRPERRPIAMATLVFVVIAMAILSFRGANAGSPHRLRSRPRARQRSASSTSGAPRSPTTAASPATRSAPTATRVRDQTSPTSARASRCWASSARSSTRRRRCRLSST